MPNEHIETPFRATQQDISNLKNTATEAARDLGSTASAHAAKAKDQARDLAKHAQEEGKEELDHAKVKLCDLANSARSYVSSRPMASLGIAVAVGMVMGAMFRGSPRSS